MRSTLLAFATALLVAGCGSSGGTDGGTTKDLATADRPNPSPSPTPSPSAMLNCGQIIDCTNNAMSQTAFTKCVNSGTPTGKQLFMALDDCITMQCGQLGQDGGTGSCGTIETCVSCVQTGMGKTQTNGNCEATQGGPQVTDPKCGQCVDPLINCANDM